MLQTWSKNQTSTLPLPAHHNFSDFLSLVAPVHPFLDHPQGHPAAPNHHVEWRHHHYYVHGYVHGNSEPWRLWMSLRWLMHTMPSTDLLKGLLKLPGSLGCVLLRYCHLCAHNERLNDGSWDQYWYQTSPPWRTAKQQWQKMPIPAASSW